MIEVRLELTEDTTIKDLLQFAELAKEHGHELSKVVEFPPTNMHEAQPEAALVFKPHVNSKKTLHNGQVPRSHTGLGVNTIGGRPIDTL